MVKKPGLLKRGLNCHKQSFINLKNIIGNIPPLYCKCRSEDGVCKLENQCYHMESDLILVNPNENKIYIILIEVKRINGELKSFKQAKDASAQLSRDVNLIYYLLPDIPNENIIIKTLIAFPETFTYDLFCNECSQFILSKEDFANNSEHLKQKLAIKDPVLNDKNENLFSTAVARIVGIESVNFSPKAINNYVVMYEATVDTLIFLDEKQQSILRVLDENAEIKNFALKGPSHEIMK